ncbi:UNVERIFIED_CONTAM: hypothetical protein H355_000773 [Colinus virginianus]|nr:hypothetical protein H355_000773 [Colinus virginianus]
MLVQTDVVLTTILMCWVLQRSSTPPEQPRGSRNQGWECENMLRICREKCGGMGVLKCKMITCEKSNYIREAVSALYHLTNALLRAQSPPCSEVEEENFPRCTYRLNCGAQKHRYVNECSTENGGCQDQCCNTIGSYHCKCPAGQKLGEDGKSCRDVDECAEMNGGCQQDCINTHGSFYCQCQAGHRLHADGRTCLNIDECAEGRARCAHRCVNTLGSFTCACNPGFELGADGKQCYRIEMEIVDSCQEDNGGCSHRCEHTAVGPRCSCHDGYELSSDGKACTDLDECETGESCCSQFCINYVGSYECTCRAGFHPSADGCGCDDVDECRLENGNCDHVCINSLGSYECACKEGYQLGANQRSCNVCLDNTFGNDCSLSCEDCMNGGRCNSENSGCVCSPGWTGIICNETCSQGTYGDGCAGICMCQNGGSCDPITGLCHCPPGVQGPFCEDGTSSFILLGLAHHVLQKGVIAACPDGYYGQNCLLPCSCSSDALCHHVTGECTCPPGWTGHDCRHPCPEGFFGLDCHQVCNCKNAAGCDHVLGTCHCLPGWQDPEEADKLAVRFPSAVHNSADGQIYWSEVRNKARWNEEEANSIYRILPSLEMKTDVPKVFNRSLCFLQLALKIDTGRTAPCSVHVGKVSVTHGLAAVPVLLAKRDLAVSKGRYGPSCRLMCTCQNAAICDHVDGSCTCGLGWTGKSCEKECLPGKYGPSCSLDCSCQHNGTCDRFTGCCHCPAGFYGHSCEHGLLTRAFMASPPPGCASGHFGERCQHRCDCGGAPCDPATGKCLCPPGKTGDKCDIGCRSDQYGPDCSLRCQCASKSQCNPYNGKCVCPATWMGPTCKEVREVIGRLTETLGKSCLKRSLSPLETATFKPWALTAALLDAVSGEVVLKGFSDPNYLISPNNTGARRPMDAAVFVPRCFWSMASHAAALRSSRDGAEPSTGLGWGLLG